MPYNGSGSFSPPAANFPAVASTLIESTKFNNVINDIATGLSTAITKDGQTAVTANIPLGGFKLTGVGAATARTDAATLASLQDGTGVYVATVGGTVDAITLTPSPAITAYAAGQTFRFIASGANTTAVTVQISGLAGPKAVTKNGSGALVAGDIASGTIVQITYDGTRFILISVKPLVVGTDVQAWSVVLDELAAGLADPGADRVVFWDESANNFAFLTVSSGIVISGTEIKAAPANFASAVIAAANGTTTIPLDNSVPLVSEGTEIVTANITPATATNKIRVQASFTVDASAALTVIAAVFRGSTCIGVAVAGITNSGFSQTISFNLDDSPASGSAQTYSIRIGLASAGTWYVSSTASFTLGGAPALQAMTLSDITV